MISMHPTEIKSIDCAPIMFYGIKKYTDEVASLWIRLADYYIKLGLFEKARDVFEEAINSVISPTLSLGLNLQGFQLVVHCLLEVRGEFDHDDFGGAGGER
jgi:pentatricopeptide repeat protein